jgi:hypothetical protein
MTLFLKSFPFFHATKVGYSNAQAALGFLQWHSQKNEKEVLTSCRENRFELALSPDNLRLAIICGDTLIDTLTSMIVCVLAFL